MKRFLFKISIFVSAQFLLAFAVDYAISDGLLKMEDMRFMSWADCKNRHASSDLIIMGNSRALSHFEPNTIDSVCHLKTYNLGCGGYAINVELMKYRLYAEHNPAPKIIVYEVSHITMQTWEAPHHHQSEQFLPLVWDKEMRPEMRKVGYSFFDVYFPLYRYWGYQEVIKEGLTEFLGITHHRNHPTDRGLYYEKGDWDGTELRKLKSISGEMNDYAKKMFEDFMDECEQQHIKVILVKSPMYIEATRKTTRLKEEKDYFQGIASKHGFIYLNYAENYPLCNDTNNFVVAIHMNPEATHKFSVDFADTLRTILKKD